MAVAKDINGDPISDLDGPIEAKLFENNPTTRFTDSIEKKDAAYWREEYKRLGIPVPEKYAE